MSDETAALPNHPRPRPHNQETTMIKEITFEPRPANLWDVWVEFSFVQEGDHVGTLVGTLIKNACPRVDRVCSQR